MISMNRFISVIVAAFVFSTTIMSCSDKKSSSDTETTVKGDIAIAIDEAYRPIMEQQLKVWDSSYPKGKITPYYTTEKEAYRLLFEDSIRLIITTRDITEEEKAWGKSKKVVFKSMNIARSAFAIIVHPSSEDDILTVGMLRSIISNEFVRKYKVIVDKSGSSATSYIFNNLMKDHHIDTANINQAGSPENVIDYVSKTPNAIGIVSLNYIYKGSQNEGKSTFIDNVKIVKLQGEDDKKGGFYQPYMGYLYTKDYPLNQDIYFVTKETKRGLGTGFVNFLCQPPGQMLFYKAWMVPLRSNLEFKEAIISTK